MEKLSKDPEFNEVLDTDMNFIIRQYIVSFIIFQKSLDLGTHGVRSKRGRKCYRMSFTIIFFNVFFSIIVNYILLDYFIILFYYIILYYKMT